VELVSITYNCIRHNKYKESKISLSYAEKEDKDTNTVFFIFGVNGLEEISIKTEAYDIFSRF
jgi:hypothetical protein